MTHHQYGDIVQHDGHALVSTDRAISLATIGGATFHAGHSAEPFAALQLSGTIVADRDGHLIDSGDTIAAVWLATPTHLEELAAAALDALATIAGPATGYQLLTRLWEQLDTKPPTAPPTPR